jgi:hypothetical protein
MTLPFRWIAKTTTVLFPKLVKLKESLHYFVIETKSDGFAVTLR